MNGPKPEVEVRVVTPGLTLHATVREVKQVMQGKTALNLDST